MGREEETRKAKSGSEKDKRIAPIVVFYLKDLSHNLLANISLNAIINDE